MFEEADTLLFALSAWEETKRPAYARAFDSLFGANLSVANHDPMTEVRLERGRALLILSSLGHAEILGAAVRVAPAVLALLPSPGMKKSVLCGRRAPSAFQEIRDAAREIGTDLVVGNASQRISSPYAPARIEVMAPRSSDLAALADRLGIHYAEHPPAWSICDLAGGLDGYLSKLQFSTTDELDWVRSDFSPTKVRFDTASKDPPGERLSRYRNPTTSTNLFLLWRGSQAAECSPTWGRFALLRAQERRVLDYDPRTFVFREPWGAPLPSLLARALTLCSGEAPMSADGQYEYVGIPPDIASTVFDKTGQSWSAEETS